MTFFNYQIANLNIHDQNTEVNQKEVQYIHQYKSNNPDVGYNRWPKYFETQQNDIGTNSIETQTQITKGFLENMLNHTFEVFNIDHRNLLDNHINEPCLNHHLANIISVYLKNNLIGFDDFVVDCEYNKNLNKVDLIKNVFLSDDEAKRFIRGYSEEIDIHKKEQMLKKSVIPDIIFHCRQGKNILVFETKKKSNQSQIDKDFDQVKLEKYTLTDNQDLHYLYGIYIEFDDYSSGNTSPDHKYLIYRNGRCV